MVTTRPDIAYALNNCARYMSNPGPIHYKAVDNIWRYLIGTQNYSITYRGDTKPILIGYSDSDWGGDITRRSTTGYLFTFNSTIISWSSKLQKTVALSSCEAEYMALKDTIKEYTWLKNVLDAITPITTTSSTNKDYYTNSTLYTDSQSAIQLAKNPEHHARTKHIDIQYHYVRDNILGNYIDLKYIPTTEQLADGLTKPLEYTKFSSYTKGIGLTT